MAKARPALLSKAELFSLVAADLRRVDEVIALDTVCCEDVVTSISRHLNASGGKRLRPAMVLLASRACGEHGDAPVRIAAVMEIIHTATLVHDDVIDAAEVRRGRASCNQEWGNQVSVLAGDWLYMQAFSIALRERDFAILDVLIDLTKMMVEGELMQADLIGRLDVTEQQNHDLIHRKTACLLSACTRLGARLARTGEVTEERLRAYGWNLGMAFQLIDDVLDFEASEAVLGKPVGNDLKEGKVTLPMILALAQCTRAERAQVQTVVREGGYQSVSLQRILEILDRYEAIARVRRKALRFCEAALEGLEPLPESRYKQALADAAAHWAVARAS